MTHKNKSPDSQSGLLNPPQILIGVGRGLKAQMDNSKPFKPVQSLSSDLYLYQDYAQRCLPPNHRVQVCQNVPDYYSQINGTHGGVSQKDDGNHILHGFGSCGDVRGCPVCGNKVGVQRAEEVKAVLRWHRKENNGIAVLVTYTCRHKSQSDLKEISKALAAAKRDFSSYTAVKNLKLLLGYKNLVSARDMTHSFINGYHPHYHDIWLVGGDFYKPGYIDTLPDKLRKFAFKHELVNDQRGLCIDAIKLFLASQWIIASVKNALSAPTVERGFDIKYREKDGSDAVGSYLVKWAYELTTPNKKVGRKDSKTPLQILALTHNENGEFNYYYAKIFRDYVLAFAGTASIYFGKGLKAAAGIEDLTDEQIADMPAKKPIREFTHTERLAVVYYRAKRKIIWYYDNYNNVVAESYLEEITSQYIKQKNSEIKMRWHLKKRIAESSAQIITELFIQQLEKDKAA